MEQYLPFQLHRGLKVKLPSMRFVAESLQLTRSTIFHHQGDPSEVEPFLGNAAACEQGGDGTGAGGYGEGYGKKVLFVPEEKSKDGTLIRQHRNTIDRG